MKIRIIYEVIKYGDYGEEIDDETIFKTTIMDNVKSINISDSCIIIDNGDNIIKIKTAYDSYVRIEVV